MGGFAHEPGTDPHAAVGLTYLQVPDVGPCRDTGRPVGLTEIGAHFDEAHHLVLDQGPDPGAVHAERAADRQPRQGRRPSRQVGDEGDEHDLGAAFVPESGPLVDVADVRPLLRDAVHRGNGQGAVRVPAANLPAVELA